MRSSRMEAGRRSTRSDGRKRRRKGEAQVEESIDDEIDDGAAASSTNTQRKPDEDAPHRAVVESEKTKKIKTMPIPHKARALNDTLKDLQSSFGISVLSNPPTKARSTANTFKSSFTSDARAGTPAQTATRSTPDTATPSRQVHPYAKKNGSSLLRPPDSHIKLLGTAATTRHATPSALDKGKGRAIDPLEGPSSEDAEIATLFDEEASTLLPLNTKNKQHQGVTSLLHLSAKKQFKLPSTPSKPSPLSCRHLPPGMRQETPSGDIKPLKSLGVISGFNSLSSDNPKTPSTSRKLLETVTAEEEGKEEGEEEQLAKPKWAQLLDSTETNKRRDTALAQDVIELLSPRKKRKGWVPTGFAENASGVIKRLQTGNNLWIHEISRTLSSSKPSSAKANTSSSSSSTTTFTGVKKEVDLGKEQDGRKKTYESLLRDLNPHLKLEILEILSPKPASLTWSSQEGGFITAGAAEKLLITRCRILKDEDPSLNLSASQAPLKGEAVELDEESQESYTPSSLATKEWESQIEGMVIFSLTAHSRTSTGITMVRKEQSRPDRQTVPEQLNEKTDGISSIHKDQNQDRLQPQLKFNQKIYHKKYNVYLPASIADLHTQMRIGDEIWAWEPWSVVDLVDSPSIESLVSKELATSEDQGTDKDSEKTLLVSRFAVLL